MDGSRVKARKGGSGDQRHSRPWIIVAVSCAGLVAFLLIARPWGSDNGNLDLPRPVESLPRDPQGVESASRRSDDAGLDGKDRREVVGSDPRDVASVSERQPEEASGPVQDLRSAVEMSLYDQLDPGMIVEAMLALMDLEVSEIAVPEPDVAGRLRFPFLDAPEGMEAELVVGKPRNQELSQFIGVTVDLEAPFEPYFLEGAVRKPPKLQVGTWNDADGKVSHFSILCSVEPSRKDSLAAGVPFGEGETAWSLHYYLDVHDPQKSTMTATRLVNGSLVEEDVPVSVQGAHWPRNMDIEQLNQRLTAKFDALKH